MLFIVGIFYLICWLGLHYKHYANTAFIKYISDDNSPRDASPFRKAFYYWTKAINIGLCNPDDQEALRKAFELASKVNPDNLYTDNNKAMFFSYFAALHLDLGSKDIAREYLDRSSALPHRAQLDTMLEKLYSALNEE